MFVLLQTAIVWIWDNYGIMLYTIIFIINHMGVRSQTSKNMSFYNNFYTHESLKYIPAL